MYDELSRNLKNSLKSIFITFKKLFRNFFNIILFLLALLNFKDIGTYVNILLLLSLLLLLLMIIVIIIIIFQSKLSVFF